MHKILYDYLAKRNLDVQDMSDEEKQVFDRWNATLSGAEISVKSIAEFCGRQKAAIEVSLENMENSTQKNERLIIYQTVYSKIKRMIEAEEAERVALEKHLTQLLDTP